MNPIQKGLMMATKPFLEFFNNKIAARPGIIGRFGKFYQFGLREYGSHTTTKMFRFYNRCVMTFFSDILSNEAFHKSFTMNNRSITRIVGPSHLFMLLIAFLALFMPFHSMAVSGPELSKKNRHLCLQNKVNRRTLFAHKRSSS